MMGLNDPRVHDVVRVSTNPVKLLDIRLGTLHVQDQPAPGTRHWTEGRQRSPTK